MLADLLDREAALAATLRAGADAAEDRGAEVTDFKDAATLESLDEVQGAVLDHAAVELARVRAALRRARDGSFGRCTACGSGIDERRLLASPAAALCVGCQAEAERQRQRP